MKTAKQRALRSLSAMAYFRPQAFDRLLKYARELDEQTLVERFTRGMLATGRWEPEQADEMVKVVLALRRYGWKTIH